MREMFHSYQGKLVGNTKDLLTRLSAEQTTESKETSQASPKSSATTSQEKTDHPAGQPTEKSKKRRIPFVALALVVVFTSLCAFSLLELRPEALAKTMLFSDTNPTATVNSIPEAAPPDQNISDLIGQHGAELTTDASCADFNVHISSKPKLCWNHGDFYWADRDVTCIYNDKHKAGAWWNMGGYNMVDKDNNPLNNIALNSPYLNQNTCTTNSRCVSDNASDKDDTSKTPPSIADQTGGDDILCDNTNCGSAPPGTVDDCGSPDGLKRQYDRFACKMIDTSVRLEGQNAESPPASDAHANIFEARYWWSKGIGINPSAYDPNGAVYVPTINLRINSDRPSQLAPACDGGGKWHCSDNSNLIIVGYSWDFTKSTGDLWQVNAHAFAPYQFFERIGLSIDDTRFGKAYTSGGAPVPLFHVMCGAQGGWAFPCSDVKASSNMPGLDFNVGQGLDEGQVNEPTISKDWLSGDSDPKVDDTLAKQQPTITNPGHPGPVYTYLAPGHLVRTYLGDTVLQPYVQKLYGLTLGLGYVLISPVILLLGYQMLWASWTFRFSGLQETVPRLILSIVAVGISYYMASTLIEVTNLFNSAMVTLHASLRYPPITINGQEYTFTLEKQGEDATSNPDHYLESFRGLVVPISRWGCIANDFVAILSTKFWTDVSGYLPMVGGLLKFASSIADAIDVAKHLGEFLMLILSIMLCVQAFMRVLLLNYYILIGPMVFGTWGLPGGVGYNVVRQWAKGFFSLLLVQTVQVFVLTTLPLIMPSIPGIPTDLFGIVNVLLGQLPRVIVLVAVIQVPKLMGTQATRAIAQAGTVVGGAVAAAGAAAYSTV